MKNNHFPIITYFQKWAFLIGVIASVFIFSNTGGNHAKADSEWVRAIYPYYVETFSGYFNGVEGGAPSGVANFPNRQGSITVSGTTGGTTLSIESINVGEISDYGGLWSAIIQFDEINYQVVNATNVTADTIDIYPTLSQDCTSVNVGNMQNGVLGQHLSPLGYQTLARYVYNYNRKTGAKNRYTDIHGFTGTYYSGGWIYGSEVGTPFSLTGGLTNGGYIGYLGKGITNRNKKSIKNAHGKKWTGNDRTGFYSNGDARTSIAGNVAGQGGTKTANLGGKSGLFESFVGIDGQSYDDVLPGRARAQLWIDGELVYDKTFSSLTRIAVPYENATTSTFTATLADSIATSIGVGQTTWWTLDTKEESAVSSTKLIPIGSSVMIYMDSWGVYHDDAFATELETLMEADAGGQPVEIYNESVAGSTAAEQLARYDTAVLPYHPDYVIIDYQINDINDGLTPVEYQESLAALIQHIVDTNSTPIVLGNLVTASSDQTVVLSGPWAEVMVNTADVTPKYIYDTTPPTVPGVPATSSPTNNGRPTWQWTASTDTESGLADPAYTIQWSQSSDFSSDIYAGSSNINSYTMSSSLSSGRWYLRVRATDNSGNSSAYSTIGSVEILSPNIYGPTVIFNDNSATVSWTTDESSTSRVDYGFTDNYASMTEDTNMVTEHHVGLTDLMPCHQYHYRVYSKDSSGNDRFSTDNTFTTEGCPAPLDTGSWRYFSGAYATSASQGTSSTASASQGIPSSGTMDSSIRFDATNLFPGKSITKYLWDFGDGKTDEGRIVNHKYSSPNRYTVKVTGYDKEGNEYVYEQTIDISPETPTIKNITSTNDTDLIIEGSGYKGDTIYLSIHSTPMELTSSVDDTGYWSYTINNASETLGEGEHTASAIDSFKLADNTELKSSATDDTKFSVTVDNGKLKVEMEKSNRYLVIIYILAGLLVLGLITFVLYRRKRKLV